MFYIFGSPRSGTTLLAQCLSSSPDIIVPDETDFIVPIGFIFDRVKNDLIGKELITKIIINSERFSFSIGQYISEKDVRDCVRDSEYKPSAIMDSLYSKIANSVGKKIAGDKSPNDLMFMRELIVSGVVGNTTKVIHIVRDIRDLMVSLNETGWASDFDEYFPRIWSSSNLYLKHEMERSNKNYLLVRYEDFVRNPTFELKKISSLLEVNYSEQMLLSDNRNSRYRNITHHRNILNPVNCDSIGKFRRNIAADVLKKYNSQAAEAMHAFGYL